MDVSIKINCWDSFAQPVNEARVAIFYKEEELLNGLTNTHGNISATFEARKNSKVRIVIRKLGHEPTSFPLQIIENHNELNVGLGTDRRYWI